MQLSAKNKPAVTEHEEDVTEKLIDVETRLSDAQKHLDTYKVSIGPLLIIDVIDVIRVFKILFR